MSTQLLECQQKLKELKINVTAEDVSEALYQLKISRATQYRYLSGYGRKVNSSIKLLEFYRNRISSRSKVLAQS